ncbi:MAG: LCP family protein, partial [Elusimicrobiota bacterium]
MIKRIPLLAFVALWAVVSYLEWRSPLIRALIEKRPVELTVLGLDETGGAIRADTILVARFEPATPAIKILQIPRDISVPSAKGRSKINAVIGRADPGKLNEELRRLLPEWNLAPQRFLQVNFNAFEEIAGGLGSLPWSGETLGGEESLDLVRYRDATGDWGRLNTQKSYLALVLKILSQEPWRLLGPMVRWKRLKNLVHTDLWSFELLSLLSRARSLAGAEELFFFQLPTSVNRHGDLSVEPKTAQELVAWWQGDPLANRTLRRDTTTLEVLNASSQPGLAMKMTRALRENFTDLDILYFGTSPTKQNAGFLVLR